MKTAAEKIGASVLQPHGTKSCLQSEQALKQIHPENMEKETQLWQHLEFGFVNLRAVDQLSHALPGLLTYRTVS